MVIEIPGQRALRDAGADAIIADFNAPLERLDGGTVTLIPEFKPGTTDIMINTVKHDANTTPTSSQVEEGERLDVNAWLEDLIKFHDSKSSRFSERLFPSIKGAVKTKLHAKLQEKKDRGHYGSANV